MPSFDVVSEVNMQEVKNAVEQVRREIDTRYDFKGSKSKITLEEEKFIQVIADDQMKLQSLQELLKQKLSKRGVSIKSVEFKTAEPAASDTLRQQVLIKQGLDDKQLKQVTKAVKELGLKVNTQIQGQQVRVIGKKRDDLQEVISGLERTLPEIELQFENFRD